MLQIPELLAPAGDLERLRYAINYGADAVYCALPEFGMRSAPTNFTPEQLSEGVIYAHARGRKVYLTMNTLPTNEEAELVMPVWVDIWTSMSGANVLQASNTPRSATMKASTPAAAASLMA